MKYLRLIAGGLVLTLLCGCGNWLPGKKAVLFYYLRSDITYTGSNGVIAAEIPDNPDGSADLIQLLEQYLTGPEHDGLRSPFPEGILLLKAEQYEGTVYLEFNDRLASLSGMDLTLACACITKTCLNLTDATSVSICAEGVSLDGAAQITMTAESLVLLENSSQ